MEKKPIVVFCTTPDMESANKIASYLVENRLAACCNIIAGITSVYSWEKEIQQDSECLMIIKTNKDKYEQLQEAILKQHPYDVPEIISTDISAGSKRYLDWISENVR